MDFSFYRFQLYFQMRLYTHFYIHYIYLHKYVCTYFHTSIQFNSEMYEYGLNNLTNWHKQQQCIFVVTHIKFCMMVVKLSMDMADYLTEMNTNWLCPFFVSHTTYILTYIFVFIHFIFHSPHSCCYLSF